MYSNDSSASLWIWDNTYSERRSVKRNVSVIKPASSFFSFFLTLGFILHQQCITDSMTDAETKSNMFSETLDFSRHIFYLQLDLSVMFTRSNKVLIVLHAQKKHMPPLLLLIQIKRSTCVFLQICVHVKPPITLWSGFKFISASWILQQILGPFFFFLYVFFVFFLNQRFVQEFLGFECPCRRNVTLKHKPPWHLLTAYGRVCGTVCIQSPDWQAEAQPALTCLLFIPGPFWLTEGVQGRVKEEEGGGVCFT